MAFCARLCEEDSRCISFGYQARTKTCQGQSNKEYNPINGSTAPGVFNFFLMTTSSILKSSRYNESTTDVHDPMLAIDGDTNTVFCTNIYVPEIPYMIAEWTIPKFVTEIVVYTRQLNASRFENIFVYMGMNDQTIEFCDCLQNSDNNTMYLFVCVYPIREIRMKIERYSPITDTANPLVGFTFRMLEIEIFIYRFQ